MRVRVFRGNLSLLEIRVRFVFWRDKACYSQKALWGVSQEPPDGSILKDDGLPWCICVVVVLAAGKLELCCALPFSCCCLGKLDVCVCVLCTFC